MDALILTLIAFSMVTYAAVNPHVARSSGGDFEGVKSIIDQQQAAGHPVESYLYTKLSILQSEQDRMQAQPTWSDYVPESKDTITFPNDSRPANARAGQEIGDEEATATFLQMHAYRRHRQQFILDPIRSRLCWPAERAHFLIVIDDPSDPFGRIDVHKILDGVEGVRITEWVEAQSCIRFTYNSQKTGYVQLDGEQSSVNYD